MPKKETETIDGILVTTHFQRVGNLVSASCPYGCGHEESAAEMTLVQSLPMANVVAERIKKHMETCTKKPN
jgi:hypothetical protein